MNGTRKYFGEWSRGYVLISAIVFLGVLTLMAVGMISYATEYVKYEHVSTADRQALALAEAGIDQAVYQLNQNSSYTGETGTALDDGTFSVSVATVDSSNKRITATGYVPNSSHPISTRVVKATLNIGTQNISFHYGIQVGNGGFVMKGGATLNGSIYSNGDIQATNGVHITGAAIAANPVATTSDQVNNTPIPIASCSSSTCITFGNASASEDFAQSFKVSSSDSLNTIAFYIKKVGTPADATVRIVNDNNGSPSTDVLMTGTLSASLVTSNFGWATTTLPSIPILDPSQTYWIVIDAASSATKYYIIGANSGGYANGAAKIGKYAGSWSNTTPSGLDGYFQLFLGGGTSYIGGDTNSSGVYIGTTVSDDAWAHKVQGATVTGTIWCQVGSVNNKLCNMTRADPTPATMPLSDSNIQAWEDDATAGGVHSGDITVGSAGATLGPEKIVGNLTVNGGGTLTQSGTLYVTGTVTVTGGGKVKLSPTYGANDGALVSDGIVVVNGGATFSGSGTAGSYPFLITTSSCPAGPGCNGAYAIAESGGAGTVALIAQDGSIDIEGGSGLKAVTGAQILMEGGATLTYDSGLINANFYSGPGGSWQVVPGSYAITQ